MTWQEAGEQGSFKEGFGATSWQPSSMSRKESHDLPTETQHKLKEEAQDGY